MAQGRVGTASDLLLPAGLAAALVAWTAADYRPLSLALVLASLAWFAVSLWSSRALVGRRSTWIFVGFAVALGWFAEEMGARHGWFFGDYHYTDVLGPRLGSVPIVIPLMWFGVCQVGLALACLVAWRQPVPPAAGWRTGALTALFTALLVTAFDLGADPYFVYQLKAWVMVKEGDWFGETVWGFAGWLSVSFTITALFLWRARPMQAPATPPATLRRAALAPVLVYAGMMAYQVAVGEPLALRVVSFFAMGIPALAAAIAWHQWRTAPAAQAQAQGGQTAPARAIDWEAAALQADPVADRAVAAIVGPWQRGAQPPADGMARLNHATRLLAGWTTNGSLAGWAPTGDPQVVAALQAYLAEAGQAPAWMDARQVGAAEDVFMEYGPLSCTLLFCASLPECYLLPQLSEVLHVAGQLEARTEYRIRQTAAMVFPVMMQGGLTRPEGGGIAQVLKVRLIHATIRHLILRGAPHEALAACVPPLARVAPGASLHEALLANGWDVAAKGQPCNQLELAYTLLTFGYVFLRGMRKLGLPLTPDQERAYLHAWNVVGHVLGVRPELLAHTMEEAAAMFDALQARAHARPVDPDVRPPLGQALMNAMAHSIGIPVLRRLPVPMTRWLIGRQTARAIGVAGGAGLPAVLLFNAGRLCILGFDRVVRLVVPDFSLTRMFTRVVGYRMLSRFLLDQARPLTLPEELLNPMRRTVAGWRSDVRGPRWVRRLETRLTQPGGATP